MYAIVEIAGQQFRVEQGQQLFVHRLKANEGDTIELKNVLLKADNGNLSVGMPMLTNASVKAKVLEHLKGDKIVVFKKKRRKGYRVKNGHRQLLTKIQIESIA
jgi:large subunit ribosomal protein L21